MAVSKVIHFHQHAQLRDRASIGAKFGNFINWIRHRMAMKAAVRELSKLSDYHLQDIGLERNMIHAAVYGAKEFEIRCESKLSKARSSVVFEETDRLAA